MSKTLSKPFLLTGDSFVTLRYTLTDILPKIFRYNGCINKSLRLGQSGTIFSPDYPVDCPYILAVGATQLDRGETVNDPESVLFQPGIGAPTATFSSGGGFSNYFSRPSYQDAAVQTYLDNYAPNYPSYIYNGNDIYSGNSNIGQNGGIYNRAGRGFPDVSANGANVSFLPITNPCDTMTECLRHIWVIR